MQPTSRACKPPLRDALSFRRPGPAHRQRAAHLIIHAAAGSDQKSVIVIGAGVGGLATAGRLARQGLDVRVLEKNGEVRGSQGLCGAWLAKVAIGRVGCCSRALACWSTAL